MAKKQVTFKLPSPYPNLVGLVVLFTRNLPSSIAKMARWWSAMALTTALLVLRFAPQYSLNGSYFWTCSSFLFVAICAQLFYAVFLYPEYYSPIKHIPTPKGRRWWTGNNTSIFLSIPTERVRAWTKAVPNNGLIRCYMLGDFERALVVGQEALSEILVSKVYDFAKPASLKVKLVRILGNGLIVAEQLEHKVQRKGLMPSFQNHHIKVLYPIFWTKAVEMAEGMEKQLQSPLAKQRGIQISDWSQRTALDIVGAAGMGHDLGAIAHPDNKFSQELEKLRFKRTRFTKWVILLCMIVLGGKEAIFRLPIKANKTSQQASDYVRDVAKQVIRQKREKLRHDGRAEKDIASVALTSGLFTDENMVDQMMTMLVAGHDTVATSLQWATLALSKHPKIQHRLREEIRAHLPPTIPTTQNPEPHLPSPAEIDSLPYLNAFCNEVLRFHPPVPSTVRVATKDTSLGGVPVPKGTQLLIVPGAINLNPEFWGPDAEAFNPERWLGEGQASKGGASSAFANLTFLHGPRGCIGQNFAKSEFLCMVAVVVGRFNVELQDPFKRVEVETNVSASPKDGVMAKLTRLEGW